MTLVLPMTLVLTHDLGTPHGLATCSWPWYLAHDIGTCSWPWYLAHDLDTPSWPWYLLMTLVLAHDLGTCSSPWYLILTLVLAHDLGLWLMTLKLAHDVGTWLMTLVLGSWPWHVAHDLGTWLMTLVPGSWTWYLAQDLGTCSSVIKRCLPNIFNMDFDMTLYWTPYNLQSEALERTPWWQNSFGLTSAAASTYTRGSSFLIVVFSQWVTFVK